MAGSSLPRLAIFRVWLYRLRQLSQKERRITAQSLRRRRMFVRRFNGLNLGTGRGVDSRHCRPILQPADTFGRMRAHASANLTSASQPLRPCVFDPRDYLKSTSLSLRPIMIWSCPALSLPPTGKSCLRLPVEEGTDVAEIGVETAPGYEGDTQRKSGAALEFHSGGIQRLYCSRRNPASISVSTRLVFRIRSILQPSAYLRATEERLKMITESEVCRINFYTTKTTPLRY